MTKITINDSIEDVISKMSGDNPGALRVCIELLEKGPDIDPDSFGGGLGAMLWLDLAGVYGSRIWMLYSDVCGKSMILFCAIVRGYQLGFLTLEQLNHAINHWGRNINCDSVLSQVQQRLPNFAVQGE